MKSPEITPSVVKYTDIQSLKRGCPAIKHPIRMCTAKTPTEYDEFAKPGFIRRKLIDPVLERIGYPAFFIGIPILVGVTMFGAKLFKAPSEYHPKDEARLILKNTPDAAINEAIVCKGLVTKELKVACEKGFNAGLDSAARAVLR